MRKHAAARRYSGRGAERIFSDYLLRRVSEIVSERAGTAPESLRSLQRDREKTDERRGKYDSGGGQGNNPKRSYLAVTENRGSMFPSVRKRLLACTGACAVKSGYVYEGETLLVIGFAETATAIGAFLAAERECSVYADDERRSARRFYLYFSESHSHASEQRLVREDLEKALAIADRILFAEDELTTGNTILSAILAIQQAFGEKTRNLRFSAISVLNGMDDAARRIYEEKQIGLHYLIEAITDAMPERPPHAGPDGIIMMLC